MPYLPLLSTRLTAPPPVPHAVSRQRLFAQLAIGVQRKLTLVTAPAGSGKSTLLHTWFAENTSQTSTYAWITLDKTSNDPQQFWTYIVTALRTCNIAIDEYTHLQAYTQQPHTLEFWLSTLLGKLQQLPSACVLILDDYHLIENMAIHQGLSFLLTHLPKQLHIVIVGRSEPPLPLARLRMQYQLLEITAEDLRFTHEEASALFQHMSVGIADPELARLLVRTEGWVAALQLAALALQKQPDPHHFVEHFTGSHRYLVDYLVEEVLYQQPLEVQQFLLNTSLLRRLCGPLCDAITGMHNGQEMIEHLERANLFVVALDHERRWYRYHHLFSEMLSERLLRTHPARLLNGYQLASLWHEHQHMPVDALLYALSAKDYTRAARLLEQVGSDLLKQGQTTTLQNWLSQLPTPLLMAHPRCLLLQAWLSVITFQFTHLETILVVLADHLTSTDAPPKVEFLGEVSVLQASLSLSKRQPSPAIRLARQALDLLPAHSYTLRAMTAHTLGVAYWLAGQSEASVKALQESVELNLVSDNIVAALSFVSELASVMISRGNVQPVRLACQRILDRAAHQGGDFLDTSQTQVAIGEIDYAENNLPQAEMHLIEGLTLAEKTCNIASLISGYLTLIDVRIALADLSGGYTAWHTLHNLVQGSVFSHIHFLVAAAHARLLLAQNDITALAEWDHTLPQIAYDLNDPTNHTACLTIAQVWHALGRHTEATTLISNLRQAAEADGRQGHVRACIQLQDNPIAVQPKPDQTHQTPNLTSHMDQQQLELIEPLSQRELEVLALIAGGSSNRDIARDLYVTLGTVKKHLNNIFGKLQVHSRTQAIARARELGLL